MKKYTRFLLMILITGSIFSCEDFLIPDVENQLTLEQMLENPAYFEGLLLHAYNVLPSRYNFHEDVASDDAVTNIKDSQYQRMATGEWRAAFYPISIWNTAYHEIAYLNKFFNHFEQVTWSWQDKEVNDNHLRRLKGEAYGLRAWCHFQILKQHGGEAVTGELLGIPLSTKVLTIDDDFRIPRSSYAQCVDQILADIDTSVKYLPYKYEDVPGDFVYNATMGGRFRNRMSGIAAMALKSRVLIYAASPAYSYLSWERAAEVAGEIILDNGGLAALSPTGIEFYRNHLDPEIIWNDSKTASNVLERENYPPSQYGEGRTNPTHDLVSTFPMSNGYPIADPASGYDEQNPYLNRDPRLVKYIVYHGNTLKENIFIDVDSPYDGINKLVTSTRSGYYLKKFLLHTQVNLVPGSVTNAEHFVTFFRFTEIFLNYAEAANEAWGPDADPLGMGFTPRQVLSAIRVRGGLPEYTADTYLNSLTPNKEDFRELVRNERRIELCFEGHRFWDIRRWKLTNHISEPVHSMRIDLNATKPYSIEFLEKRGYSDYMIYGPIPYEETLKYDLIQNKGW